MSDLKQNTLRGAGWVAGVQVVIQIIRFGLSLVLARLLSPADFGFWGMALVFSAFAGLIGDMGLGAALIQKSEIERRHLDSAFWANAAMGFALTALVFLFAPLLARVYGQPGVASLLRLASLEFTVSGLVVVNRVLIVREMKFRTIALAELVGTIGAGALACWMGSRGYGSWSLAALNLGASVIIAWVLLWAKPWMPGLALDRTALRELLGFGFFLQAYNLVNYWLRNFDKLVIGRLFGGESLGHYTRAYTTMLLPQSQLIGVLHGVLWPALARCSTEPGRLCQAYLRSLAIVCFLCFPCMTGLCAVTRDAVLVLFGEKWLPATETLRWMCVGGFAQIPLATVGWLYLATGRTRRLLGWGIGSGVLIVGGIFAGAYWGGRIEGISIGHAVTSFLLLPAAYVVVSPVCGLAPSQVWKTCMASAAASVFMALAVAIISRFLPDWFAPWMRLGLLSLLGGLVYLGLCSRTAVMREVLQIFLRRSNASVPVNPVDVTTSSG